MENEHIGLKLHSVTYVSCDVKYGCYAYLYYQAITIRAVELTH